MRTKKLGAIVIVLIFVVLAVAFIGKIIANHDKSGEFGEFDESGESQSRTDTIEKNNGLKIKVSFTGVSLAYINTSNSKLKSEEDISKAIISWVEQIGTLTDTKDWYKAYGNEIDTCNIYINFDKNMQAGAMLENQRLKLGNSISATIDINVSMFEGLGSTGLAHELTHLVCGESFSKTLGEGLADYMGRILDNTSNCTGTALSYASADEYMLNYYIPNIKEKFSEENFQAYKLFEKKTIDGMLYITTDYPFTPTSAEENKKFTLWHMYVESFTTHLIKKYGLNQFMIMFKQAKSIDDYKILNPEGGIFLLDEWMRNNEWLNSNQ